MLEVFVQLRYSKQLTLLVLDCCFFLRRLWEGWGILDLILLFYLPFCTTKSSSFPLCLLLFLSWSHLCRVLPRTHAPSSPLMISCLWSQHLSLAHDIFPIFPGSHCRLSLCYPTESREEGRGTDGERCHGNWESFTGWHYLLLHGVSWAHEYLSFIEWTRRVLQTSSLEFHWKYIGKK